MYSLTEYMRLMEIWHMLSQRPISKQSVYISIYLSESKVMLAHFLVNPIK